MKKSQIQTTTENSTFRRKKNIKIGDFPFFRQGFL